MISVRQAQLRCFVGREPLACNTARVEPDIDDKEEVHGSK